MEIEKRLLLKNRKKNPNGSQVWRRSYKSKRVVDVLFFIGPVVIGKGYKRIISY